MKLKNFLTPLFIVCTAGISMAYAGMIYTEMLKIPWGEDAEQVKHRSYQGLHNGPLSFQVDNDRIIIFDTENAMLKTFNNKGLISAEKVHLPHILDFYQDDENRYLLSPQRVYRQEGNNFILVSELDDLQKMFYGFYKQNNSIQTRYADGVVQCDQNQFTKASTYAIHVTRTLPETVNIQIGEKTVFLHVPDVGSVDYLGSTPDKLHYIYAESIIQHVPLSVARYVYLLDEQAHIMARILLPQQQYTYIFREFYVDTKGELYHMQSSKDGIHIIRWKYHADTPEIDAEYPEQFNETYHFNEFIEQKPEAELVSFAKAADGIVTRTQALVTGDEYVQHIWTATASNIGTTSTVTTPSWIQIGQNQRIPYQWGGWSTIVQFDAGIAAGKLAGDMNTGPVDLNNSVGADCSGFVSVCWNTSKKYRTSTFYNCSSQLSNFNNLLPGDATNKAGSHIRMFVKWTNDGKLVQVEETASGNPGWAARYYTWTLSQITEYVPIRYNYIQNSLIPRPTLLALISESDSVSISWTADESYNFTGYKIYRKQLNEENYTLIAII
ncbi:MAG: hypothetical protein KAT14_04935, partial [Candidatus Marinimicrobia bacterium]|nr:hypothetical protein [Candidatus Neomarinimicrobiota bacterium]